MGDSSGPANLARCSWRILAHISSSSPSHLLKAECHKSVLIEIQVTWADQRGVGIFIKGEEMKPISQRILPFWWYGLWGSILSSKALWLTLLIAKKKKKKWERALKFSVRGCRPKCTENHLGFIFHQWGFRQQIQHISFQTQVSILSFSHPNTHGSNNEPYINPVNFTVEIIRKWHPNLCQ